LKVSVCLAATRPDTVGATARSIAAQSHDDWELLVIVQGGAAAAVAEAVEREMPGGRARVLPQEGKGLSRARNAAVRATDGDVIAMTDDDCEAAPDWLAVLVDRFASLPQAGIVGGAVVAPSARVRGPGNCPSCHPGEVLYEPAARHAGPPPGFGWIGANFAFRRSTAELVGEFDELLGAGAHFPVAEEIDFMRRAEALGVSMATTPKAVVHHTYGWRHGVRAVWRLQRNYARGNGAYAGKLTLLGDPGGAEDLATMRHLTMVDWIERRRPVALPAGIRRYHHFAAGYRDCLQGFCVDDRGLLQRRSRQPELQQADR
jgi:glycosyltransferase involved in cell wall biosynthesis